METSKERPQSLEEENAALKKEIANYRRALENKQPAGLILIMIAN
jgi:hypothetical protein